MRPLRKLRVVESCPMPETPIRPVVYGAAPWGRLPHNPTADELTWRVRAQSLRTRGGIVAEPLDYATSARWLAHFTHKARVTVPPPRAA